MALDQYSPCPCGSGKKFKWCCQPIHVSINKAFAMDSEGQHEAALKLMEQVVAEHADNPEAWGRRAQLLYQNDQVEEAEKSLDKAFAVNPKYPFGHLIRGLFRYHEGEFPGALLLFRKAAEYYDAEARDVLGQVYALIGECEFKLHHPVAAGAALKISLRNEPANDDLRNSLAAVFGDKSPLPASARKDYTLMKGPAAGPTPGSWAGALEGASTGRLSDAVRAFEQVTASSPDDAAAWYNLGLTRAWIGDNHAAIEALDRYVTLEGDEARAAEAGTLTEVLRCGHGMEAEANYLEHSVLFQMRDPQAVIRLFQEWENTLRLIGLQMSQEQQTLTGLILEKTAALTPELAATQIPRLGAYMLVIGDRVRLWHTSADRLNRVVEELTLLLGPAVSTPRREQRTANFSDIIAEALVFPINVSDAEEARRRVQEPLRQFFEETWIHRPLRSLNQIPPVDAAGHGTLRKKLRGAIQFLQDCAQPNPGYDFDRLRRRLGLLEAEAPAAAAGAAPDIEAMGAAELSALASDNLSDEKLEQAYRAALKLDARELAGRFAKLLIARPPLAGKPDRFPIYSQLVSWALAEGNSQAALDYVNRGAQADAAQNEGRRGNDYELRRAQVHARRGEMDEAQKAFERLIERAPSELRYRVNAAESMLSTNQPDRALHFAEQGLAQARKQNDRDSEDHFKELVEAARKRAKS